MAEVEFTAMQAKVVDPNDDFYLIKIPKKKYIVLYKGDRAQNCMNEYVPLVLMELNNDG